MRIIVMATGPFSVPMFKALVLARHDVVALVTRPEKAAAGRRPPASPARLTADEFSVPVLTPISANDPEFVQQLSQLHPELLVVCDYGQILSKETLSTTRWGGINLHGSLLPAYRGAAPVQWALYRGETETGVTVIHMNPKLDAGPCLCQVRVAIGPRETAPELEARLAEAGAPLVLQAVEQLQDWDGTSPLGHPQNASRVSTARRLKKEDAQVTWSRSACQIVDQIRAFQPWPGCMTDFLDPKGVRQALRLLKGQVAEEAIELATSPVPGSILPNPENALLVQTGQGILRIDQVIPANRRAITGADFLRGYRLKPGDALGATSPSEHTS